MSLPSMSSLPAFLRPATKRSTSSCTSSITKRIRYSMGPRWSLKSLNTSPDSLPPKPAPLIWLMAGIVFCATAAHAIDPNRAMSQYVRDRWGTEQGLPRGPVYAIAQTRDGYLWIGTEAGLIRFDGWNFRLIQDDSGTFATTGVLGLVADNDGGLWVRLRGLIVLRYRHGVFENPLANSESYSNISAMSRANHGGVLVAKMEEGAYEYRNGGFTI